MVVVVRWSETLGAPIKAAGTLEKEVTTFVSPPKHTRRTMERAKVLYRVIFALVRWFVRSFVRSFVR